MLTKTLSEAKKKQRNILIKAMNNDIGSIDSAKDSWNPAQISERAKDISYIRSLVDSWNPAQLNEALKMLDLPVIDTWNPAQIEEQRRNLVFYLVERALTGNPITLNILGNLTPEVTNLKVTMAPIQDLSHGDPSPTNICPISGRTEASVTRAGINQWDEEWEIGMYSVVDGQKNANVNNIRCKNPIPCIPNTSYYYKCTTNSGILYYDKSGNYLSYTTGNNKVITTPANCYYITFYVTSGYGTTYNNDISINYPSTDTDYHAYQAETQTHQYSETIYGGVDDFVNGVLSVEWGYIASYDGETLPGEWISDRDVYAPGTTPTTGAEVCYKLATPTTISTSAEEITLLKGTNVLSTDGDSIELKYKQNF